MESEGEGLVDAFPARHLTNRVLHLPAPCDNKSTVQTIPEKHTASNMADTPADFNELFASPNTELQQDVLGELQSISRIHSLSPQELFFKWEAYSIKMGPDTRIDYKTARDFKKDLQDALERESRGKAHTQSGTKRAMAATPRNTNTSDVFGVYIHPLLFQNTTRADSNTAWMA